MAEVKPFKAIRPTVDKAHLVASRAYGSYSKDEMIQKLKSNPYTFLHVLRPEYGKITKTYSETEEYLHKIKDKFEEFMRIGILHQDEKAAYYIYRQHKNNQVQTGIIGRIAVDDYFNGTIKKHEDTLSEREEKLKNYLRIVDINAEPVCFAFEDHSVITSVMEEICSKAPVYDFSTTNEIRHQLWTVEDDKNIERVEKAFKEIPSIYIADGHHRSASSCLLGLEKRVIRGKTSGALSDYFMGIFVPESELIIMDFNRVVKGLNGLSPSELIEQIRKKFEIQEIGNQLIKASALHEIAMYMNGKAYRLKVKPDVYDYLNPVSTLDSDILTKEILDPILGIQDIKNDKRIDFIGGHEGMEKLQQLVDSGKWSIAFSLFPVTMEQLKKIADHNQVMPPKSTWIEPKLRSGLTIYSLSKK